MCKNGILLHVQSTRLENRVSWVQIPPEQLIFLWKKRLVLGIVVICCIALLCCLVVYHVHCICSAYDTIGFTYTVYCTVQNLLLLNAPLRPRTPDEDTPRELANRYKQREVVELLGEGESP